jgi:hypothetical protein
LSPTGFPLTVLLLPPRAWRDCGGRLLSCEARDEGSGRCSCSRRRCCRLAGCLLLLLLIIFHLAIFFTCGALIYSAAQII